MTVIKKLLFLAVMSFILLLAACGEEDAAGTGDGDMKLLEDGKFTFAMSGLYKPFNYEEGGELKGFDVEIGNAISEKLGLEADPVTTPWETILQSLKGDRFDAIIGSMAYTDERAKEVDFTRPYYLSGGTIFVGKDNDEIKTAEDLRGKKIGVVAQSTFWEVAEEYSDDLQFYNSDVTALQDLTVSGRLDAVITAPVVGYEAIEAGLEIKETGDTWLFIEEACIAVNKGNEELVEALNAAIEEMIEDGTYEEISMNMFGVNLLEVETEGVDVYR